MSVGSLFSEGVLEEDLCVPLDQHGMLEVKMSLPHSLSLSLSLSRSLALCLSWLHIQSESAHKTSPICVSSYCRARASYAELSVCSTMSLCCIPNEEGSGGYL